MNRSCTTWIVAFFIILAALAIGLGGLVFVGLKEAGWESLPAESAGFALGLLIFSGLSYGYIITVSSIYNHMVTAKNEGEKLLLDIDVQLQRRLDLVPKITTIAERFLQHERDTLESVIRARKQFESIQNRAERLDAGALLGSSLVSFFAVAEKYPNIVSGTNI